MEISKTEMVILEKAVDRAADIETNPELLDLRLAYTGGGMGDVVAI
jgi:hypothetical protein